VGLQAPASIENIFFGVSPYEPRSILKIYQVYKLVFDDHIKINIARQPPSEEQVVQILGDVSHI